MTNSFRHHVAFSNAVNIQLNDLSDTRKNLIVSLDLSEVGAEYQAVIGEITKVARVPGFRPGRAPASLILKRFSKEVLEELKKKVVNRA